MELEAAALGISYRHSSPYHPQTCGKVERFHQTLKRWLAKQPKAASVAELQAQLDRFRAYYNTVRPYPALHRRTPEAAFTARPKAAPVAPAGQIPAHYRVRKDRIDSTGVITLRHNSRLHHIGPWKTAHRDPSPGARGRPRRAGPHRRRRAAPGPHPRSDPGLPGDEPAMNVQRCPETGVNDVSRHHTPGGTTTIL